MAATKKQSNDALLFIDSIGPRAVWECICLYRDRHQTCPPTRAANFR